MKVLLADDHTLFKEGLRNLLIAHGIEVVGTANDGLEALEQARALGPDVILMDIQMPRCDGLKATRLIKTALPDVKIIMLTTSANDEDLFEAIKSGASGYLLKSLDAEKFFELLAGVAQGEAAISPDLAARILHEFAHPTPAAEKPAAGDDPDQLTGRQAEVLQLVGQGLTYKEIAVKLFITERTVKYHMSEILQKLHLQNKSQVIAYAARTGLITAKDE
ncbi:MAG: response regulator transcription factor [Chloroflexi bacterium]|nr:response regulator transcription factor [Chloroflexota bacterium]MBI3734030.1 response regulator transcription factor [Chloroflexota bacterium]